MSGDRGALRRRPAPHLAAVVSCALLCAAVLAGCGSVAADVPDGTPAPTAATSDTAAPATASARAESEKASRAMNAIGARYAQALAEHGVPVDSLADDATLSQLARGICDQTAAGTPEAELRDRLEPVIRYSRSLVDDAPSEKILTDTFLTAARTNVC